MLPAIEQPIGAADKPWVAFSVDGDGGSFHAAQVVLVGPPTAVAIHVHMMRAVVTLPGHEYEAASPGLSHADMLPRTVTVNKADKC